ncbi:MAG: hypothetical protein CVV44_13710 [Spirochaetae bacterium HGW-Spirochaetae-1]|nr:MAG: hypothetical protein CVV44_13710 [Spirochaetae bacterium HGW-Spirochaetae-1]
MKKEDIIMPNFIKKRFFMAGISLALLLQGMAGNASKLNQEDGVMTNHSTEYVRSLNRNTSIDPDAAFYNPAGLAFMARNGLYINFSSQTYHVEKTHTMNYYAIDNENSGLMGPEPTMNTLPSWKGNLPDEYGARLTAPVLPGFDVVWKQDNWAAYLDIAVMQAATDMTFGDGLAVLDWGILLGKYTGLTNASNDNVMYQCSRDAEAVRNEMYIGATLGGAYKLLNWLSAGGGFRVIYATGNMSVKVTDTSYIIYDPVGAGTGLSQEDGDDWDIDTDTKGIGYGIILGTHFRPEALVPALKGLDAALRLEYYLPMELKKKTNSLMAPATVESSGNIDIFKDGTSNHDFNGGTGYAHGNGTKNLKVTYAPTVNLGLSYLLFDWLKLLSSAQVSFRQLRDLDGREKDYNMGFQAGGGVEFILSPQITLSTGYLYNDFGIKPEKRDEADMLLSSHTIGAGAKFSVNERLDINIGAFYQYFQEATTYYVLYVKVTDGTNSYMNKTFKESRYSVSIGVTYRMFGGDSGTDSEAGKKTIF